MNNVISVVLSSFLFFSTLCPKVVADLDEIKRKQDEESRIHKATYVITYYCGCEKCCGIYASAKYRQNGVLTASGKIAKANHTIAATLPFGTKVKIDGKIYVVEDRGVGKGHIDIYCNDHQAALNGGRKVREVEILYE